MSSYQLITRNMNVEVAESFLSTVQSNSSFYVFNGKHTPYTSASDDVITIPVDTVVNDTAVYDDMMFGRRVKTQDVSIMIPRINWQYGTVYSMYDDKSEIYGTNFFVMTQEGVGYNVYKCLYNNNGQPSTVEPTGTDHYPFESPSDGYIWKYMYSFDDYT